MTAGDTLVIKAQIKSNQPVTKIEWKVDGGSALTDGGDISGALTTELQVANYAAGDAGTYTCTATNATGATESNDCVVTTAS
jgi:hypothetical protein